ncbi:MAG: hypothetical protein CSB21_03675 [Deltaproteobacteria bacterium]|nr:MAG: hypothetical protein CSB21_03675 [Deltaproteobacteria bacterium]
MDEKNIKLSGSASKENFKVWKFLLASIFFHFSIICAAAIDFDKGSKYRELKENSLNVAIVEKKPDLPKKGKNLKNKESGKNINISEESPKNKKINSKKTLVSKKKKKLVKKKKNKSAPGKIFKNTVKSHKKEDSSKDRLKNIAMEIEGFKKDIAKEEKGKKDNDFFSDLSKNAEIAEKIDIYRYKIASSVEKMWAIPAELVNNDESLETSIVFSVLGDGSIKEIWFDKKSSNTYFDSSVYNAVQKAAPFPSHPKGINKKFILVGLRFTPSGLQ